MSIDGHQRPSKKSSRSQRLALAVAFCAASCSRSPTDVAAAEVHGREIFEARCALCHGRTGAADGPASYLLFPPARDFRAGRFKVASSLNGAPTDEDLVRVLRRGLPGSAMPAWSWLPEKDLLALARYARELAVEGITEELSSGKDPLPFGEAREVALERMTPTTLVETDLERVSDETVATLGATLFADRCSACHGPHGEGRPDVVRPDVDQTRNWARALTAGVLKGGASSTDLARSLQVGMHGTAMPSVPLDRAELSALVAFVQRLIPAGSEERLVQHRETLVARRVPGPLPLDPEDARWRTVEAVTIVLAPLWWREGAVLEADVRALRDDDELALLVRWAAPTHDVLTDEEPPYAAPRYADAVAVQLSPRADPPFFGMGPAGEPARIWHWRAMYPFSLGGLALIDDLVRVPHSHGERPFAGDRPWSPEYLAAQGRVEIAGDARATSPEGMQVLEHQTRADVGLRSMARWIDGSWAVVLLADPTFATTEPGNSRDELSLAFAIWNGAIADLRGQKSVTIWHRLRLADGGS